MGIEKFGLELPMKVPTIKQKTNKVYLDILDRYKGCKSYCEEYPYHY